MARAKGWVLVSETDGSVFFHDTAKGWGTPPHITPMVFKTRDAARRYQRRNLSDGRALAIPGDAPRILSAHAAGL